MLIQLIQFEWIADVLEEGLSNNIERILQDDILEQLKVMKNRRNFKMISQYKVITLCGSTKFKNEFFQEQKRLTLEGNIVISVGLFGHADEEFGSLITDEIKVMLDDMHKRKIDMAEEIFVINKNGYIGSSTKSEIEYAKSKGKIIKYLEE